jgi:hypothetical protein
MAETMTTTKPTNEDLINQMYDASLAGQKTQLEQSRDQGMADLQAEQERLQKQTDANLNRTYVEAARDQKNYAEVQNAYGLTSGAMAQARLALDNQLEADLTALRGAQANIDANIEREKTMLSQQYMAAIAQAQADNDLKRAQALYDQAKRDEDALRQNQLDAGKLMASVGDYTILANLYGLTPQQLALLMPNGVPGAASGDGGYDYEKYFDAKGNPKSNAFATWDEYLAWLEVNGGVKGGEDPDTYGDVFSSLKTAWNNSAMTLEEINKAVDIADGLTWQQKLTLKELFSNADAEGRRDGGV